MKERRGINILRSLISPFGTVSLKPLKGLQVEVENIFDTEASVNGVPAIDEKGNVQVPSGSTAKVFVRRGDETSVLRIDDYRGRPGHTPGAKITGEDIDIDLSPKKRKKFILGIGYAKYEK